MAARVRIYRPPFRAYLGAYRAAHSVDTTLDTGPGMRSETFRTETRAALCRGPHDGLQRSETPHGAGFAQSPFSSASIAFASRSIAVRLLRRCTHSALRIPCVRPFCEDTALPASVTGPVDDFHGVQRLIFAACAARCSGVQRRGMLRLPFVG